MTHHLHGSSSDSNCYCQPRRYYHNYSGVCIACQADGVVCPGGFSSSSPRTHTGPLSQPGWYMMSTARAEKCKILLPDRTSVCTGGHTYGHQSQGCIKGHVGLLCTACDAGYVRNHPEKPCVRCSNMANSLVLVLYLNAELAARAIVALFLTKTSIDGAVNVAKLDSVLVRIYMQFTMVSSVLTDIDLSAAIRSIALHVAKGSDESSIESNFPSWFGYWIGIVFAISPNFPAFARNQQIIECLTERLVGQSIHAFRSKLVVPMIFWLFYPLLACTWVLILSIIVVKVGWWLKHVTHNSVEHEKFIQILMEAGVTQATAVEAGAKANHTFIMDTVISGKLSCLHELSEQVGIHVACEILAETCPAELLSKKPTQSTVKRPSSGKSHVDHRKRKRAAALSQVLSLDPSVLKGLADEEAWADCAHTISNKSNLWMSSVLPKHVNLVSSQRRRVTLHSPAQLYPIFGVFRDTSTWAIFRDLTPAWLITLYSIWEVITKRYLNALKC